MSKLGSFRSPPSIYQGVTRNIATDADTLAHPPAEILAAVARTDMPVLLRRLGVPGNLAPDLLQEVVTTAYVALHRKGAALPLPAEHEPRWSRVRPFLAGIVRRHARDARKRAYQRHEVPAGLDLDMVAAGAAMVDLNPEQRAAGAQRLAVLLRILTEMPPEYAQVLTLYAVRELTVPEIAAELGVNANTVKSRLARARTHAQQALRNLPDEQRRLLEGAPLAAMFFWDSREEPIPSGRRRALGASALVLVAGFWIIGSPIGFLPRQSGPSEVLAVNDHVAGGASVAAPQEPATPTEGPTAQPDSAPAPAAPAAAPLRAAPVRSAGSGDTLPIEKVLIHAARRALDTEDYALVLLKLAKHEQWYPDGKLAGVREELKADVRARLRAKATASR
jgi:RNA polymerase sigma-70 factor (ECF subfamily)